MECIAASEDFIKSENNNDNNNNNISKLNSYNIITISDQNNRNNNNKNNNNKNKLLELLKEIIQMSLSIFNLDYNNNNNNKSVDYNVMNIIIADVIELIANCCFCYGKIFFEPYLIQVFVVVDVVFV